MSEGMSRRDLIKASAVAGATAWTAPMIIDSLASPAAANSVGCAFACSATYVFYKVGTTIFYSGYQNATGTVCNSCKTENQTGGISHDVPCQTCTIGTDTYSFWGGQVDGGTCATSEPLYYLLSNSCPVGAPAGMLQAVPDPNCSSHLILAGDGHSISPGAGVTFLGAFAFSASKWFGTCPNGEGFLAFPSCGDPC
jgi:hypothetical protein